MPVISNSSAVVADSIIHKSPAKPTGFRRYYELIVLLISTVVFLSGTWSPPHLQDDVDAFQALMARNMLQSGDWVTARVNGVRFLDKAPLKYWMTVFCYKALGPSDWVARIPIALAAIALCWVVFRFGKWAISEEAGFYAGLFLSTCIGLFLFTRIVIPDVVLTLSITITLYSFLRAVDETELRARKWAYLMATSLAAGVLLKGMIGLLFPAGAIFLYLLFSGGLFAREIWRRLYPITSLLVFVVLAAPWHVLATLRNPPYLDFTMHAGPGEYRGFFWFYFIDEQLLRFLNMRYPRDYNTVPRLQFWLLNLVWLFPWSVYITQLRRLSYRPATRAGRAQLMALCWIGFVMVFFTFSTTQEYYSMPIYPALALLLGSAVSVSPPRSLRAGLRVLGSLAGAAAIVIFAILVIVRGVPTPGDIYNALSHNAVYTLSMGHIHDLTIKSFAYLRLPLFVAGLACLIGLTALWSRHASTGLIAVALMMVVFFQAMRLALVVFDPYLSSQPIADVLNHSPKGTLIISGDLNRLSSLFFYRSEGALLLNGRQDTMEYGSYAPDAPQVFITNDDFKQLWLKQQQYYLVLKGSDLSKVGGLVPADSLHVLAAIGGKTLFSNHELVADNR